MSEYPLQPLLGVPYPDVNPDVSCWLCGEDYDEDGRCGCDDESWFDEDQGHDE
jgi:hypothetical protein